MSTVDCAALAKNNSISNTEQKSLLVVTLIAHTPLCSHPNTQYSYQVK